MNAAAIADPWDGVFQDAARAALMLRQGTGAENLAADLYATWYARIDAAPDCPPPDFPVDIVAVLRAVHAANRRWEEGWSIEGVGPNGMVTVVKQRELRALYRGDYVVPAHPGLVGNVGDVAMVTSRRDQVDPDGSWWRTRGRTWSEVSPPGDLVRLYWSVAAVGLPILVGRLTELLATSEDPWMLKVAVDAGTRRRADSSVLYLRRDHLGRVVGEIDRVHAEIAATARAMAPPFSLVVGDGLAVAVDPGSGESFGQHRCRIVAEAILGVADDLEEATAGVRARFRAEGIDPDRPYATGPRLPWERG